MTAEVQLKPLPLKPLHYAAQCCNPALLRGWLEKGKGLSSNDEDDNGMLPIHVLLKNEFRGHLNLNNLNEFLDILIEYNCDVNAKVPESRMGASVVGESPLSLAVLHKFEDVALVLVKNGADTTVTTPKFPGVHSLASKIAETMPDVMMEIFNSGINLVDTAKWDYPDKVELDWSPILQYSIDDNDDIDTWHRQVKTQHVQRETSFLYSLLDVPPKIRSEYLNHPLVSALIFLRSRKTQKYLYMFQGIMALYAICYMVFIYHLYFNLCKHDHMQTNMTQSQSDVEKDLINSCCSCALTSPKTANSYTKRCEMSIGIKICAYLLALVMAGFALVEVIMLFRIDFKYLWSWRSWVHRFTIIIMAATLWPALRFKSSYRLSWQYPIAALATFLAWVMFLLQMELVPQIKVYLEALATIVVGVVRIILLFFPLFIGFYMGFNLMFENDPDDNRGIMSFIKMAVDYGSNEYGEEMDKSTRHKLWYTATANSFNLIFIIVIQIVFMNFMLAESINRVRELRGSGEIASLSHKVQSLCIINLIFPYHYDVAIMEPITQDNGQPGASKHSLVKPRKNDQKHAGASGVDMELGVVTTESNTPLLDDKHKTKSNPKPRWSITFMANDSSSFTDKIRSDITQLLKVRKEAELKHSRPPIPPNPTPVRRGSRPRPPPMKAVNVLIRSAKKIEKYEKEDKKALTKVLKEKFKHFPPKPTPPNPTTASLDDSD